jgi:uncharacterized protein YuzE
MRLEYDERADAVYVEVAGPIPDGGVDSTEELDQDRNVNRDGNDRVVGYEFLNARRLGVKLDDLEHRDELARLFRDAGFPERTWGSPRPVKEGRR